MRLFTPLLRRTERVVQPRPRNCIQTVLAAALRVPLEPIEAELESTEAVQVDAVRRMLARIGLWSRLVRVDVILESWPSAYDGIGGPSLLAVGIELYADDDGGHAYLVRNGQILDPLSGEAIPLRRRTLGRLSYLLVLPPDAPASEGASRLRTLLAAS